MRDHRIGTGILSLALVLAGWGVANAAEKTEADTRPYPGVTRPSELRVLSFSYPGVVREVLVKEGDVVKAGQALMKLDDRIDRVELAKAEIDAKSELKIRYSRQEAALKKVQLARTQQLYDQNRAASDIELENAKLEAQLADTHVSMSEEEMQTKKLDADKQRIKVELGQLTSTIDGVVQRLAVKEGEYADPQQGTQRPVCIVVKNNPLKVEVYLPTALTNRLAPGQELEVAYPNTSDWQRAKITFFDPVADAGSGMRKLELELPNPVMREAGWQVNVRVPGMQ